MSKWSVRPVRLFPLVAAILLSACGGGGSEPRTFANCGNGVIDAGEACDDSNTLDTDACLSTCVQARCGDGFVNRAAEDCDGINVDTNSAGQFNACADLGFAAGTLTCAATCQFDVSACGAAFTATPTPTSTSTPTATPEDRPTATETPTPTPLPCGNGLIEEGEACEPCENEMTCEGCLPGGPCEVCPEDCTVSECTAGAATTTFRVEVDLPAGQDVGTVSVLLGYRSDIAILPAPTGSRFTNLQSGGFRTLTDFDFAVQYIYTLPTGLKSGGLFEVRFASCTDGAPPTIADFSCIVQACTGNAGEVDGCGCSVSQP